MEIRDIELANIDPAPYQPREGNSVQGIEQLASSLKELGLLQPIVVSPNGGRYTLIAGNRRLQAATMLGWATIPAHIQSADAPGITLMSLTENLSRVDLNPIETARTVHHLVTDLNLSRVEVAGVFGYDPRWVSEQLKLLEMPDFLIEALELGVLSKTVCLELIRIPDHDMLQMYTAYAIQGGCTARMAADWVRQANASIAARDRRRDISESPPLVSLEPPPAIETPTCWICRAPDTHVMLETLNLCFHCRSALEPK